MEDELHLLTPWQRPYSPDGLLSELKPEIGSNHPLHAKQAKALAAAKDRDDVLFEITEGVSRKYAVVHLGWTGKFENSAVWPRTVYFDSLEQCVLFAKSRYPDPRTTTDIYEISFLPRDSFVRVA